MAKTVLVVDDDPDFVEMLQSILLAEGYSVVPCPAPTQAHQIARQTHPDILIVDLFMPVYNGWQVIEQIKSDPRTACIRTIVCTAAQLDAQQLDRLRRSHSEVLIKPFELDDLLQAVVRAAARDQAC